MKMTTIIMVFFYLFCLAGIGQNLDNSLMNIAKIKEDVKTKRVSSYDRSGGNNDRYEKIEDGDKLTLCDIEGAGVINHIWITIAPPPEKLSRNDIILRMYWDGSEKPSVISPIGPFFGQGWEESYNYASLPLAAGPTDGRGLVSYLPMPFAKGAKIEIENQTGRTIDAFYYYVDYVELEELPDDMGRFHAWYNHELTEALPEGENEWGMLETLEGRANSTNLDGKDNYLFMETEGKGHFVGVNYFVQSPGPMWYGEGDDMFCIDGDEPTLVGTGTEDYFNTSWCPKEPYSHPFFGYPRVNEGLGFMGRTHVYRFHIADPVYFDKSIKVSIEHGHNNCLTLDLASVAYWYQNKAVGVPAIPGKVERTAKPMLNVNEVHRWRHAWRESMGGDPKLWGNELAMMKDAVPQWQIIGPFDSPENNNAFQQTYPPQKEIDLEKSYEGKDEKEVSWKRIQVGADGYVDLDKYFFKKDYAAGFAYTKVWAPADKTYALKFGSDDGAKIWVNNEKVYEMDTKRAASPDQETVNVQLKKGWNDLLVMINDEAGAWGFYLRFVDPGKDLKYKTE